MGERVLFTAAQPLGPEISPTDPAEIRKLYSEFTGHREIARDDPTFILGRKGSGKTSLLLGPLASERELIVLTESNAYERMRYIDDLLARIYQVSVDHASAVWLAAFWHVAIAHVALTFRPEEAETPEGRAVATYIDAFSPDPHVENQADADLSVFLFAVEDVLTGASWRDHVETLLGSIGPTEAPLRTTYKAARTLLDERPYELAIVIDSLEDLQFRLVDLEHVLRGLFRAVGLNAREGAPTLRIRCCFPSELAGEMHALSSNPAKDFRRRHNIHWRGSELMQVAAHRYRSFLLEHEPELLPDWAVEGAAVVRHEVARQLLEIALPPAGFKNRNDGEEDPIGYLLRHTQLLPRQVIQLLNAILSHAYTDVGTTKEISHDIIRRVVLATEPGVVDGIFTAHAARYPLAKDVMKDALDGLPSTIEADALEAHYAQRAIKRKLGVHFHEFLTMAVEMGAIGERFARKDTDRYLGARFQYSFLNPQARRIDTASGSELCIHPLFSGAFGGLRSRSQESGGRYIYPYGSTADPETDEVPF